MAVGVPPSRPPRTGADDISTIDVLDRSVTVLDGLPTDRSKTSGSICNSAFSRRNRTSSARSSSLDALPLPRSRARRSIATQLPKVPSFTPWDARQFVEKVNDDRNVVHPRRQAQLTSTPDAVMLCWAPTRAVLHDLGTTLSATSGW